MNRKLVCSLAMVGGLAFLADLVHADDFASPLFGLATAPNGDILVADAGAGVVVFDGQPRLDIALPGITDISPIGRGSLWVSRTGDDGEADTGQSLLRVARGGTRTIANLFAFEDANDPDGQGVDSNPFDVQSLGGRSALVVDAAANDLLWVDNQGQIDVLAVFPTALASTANVKDLFGCPAGPPEICDLPEAIPAQPVPTSVAIGPDGYFYVGELKGFPAPVGESRIWRVSPAADWAQCGASPDCTLVFAGGFTSIIDLAFGPDGQLYVVELDEASWFAVEVLPGEALGGTINACDLDTLTCTETATGLPIVTAITFGKHGRLWATQNALIPGLATVVEIP
jgi:hypothetical protein